MGDSAWAKTPGILGEVRGTPTDQFFWHREYAPCFLQELASTALLADEGGESALTLGPDIVVLPQHTTPNK